MPLLADLVDGNIIYAADINARYDENYLWAGDVDAAGYAIDNCGPLRRPNNCRVVPASVSLADDATVALETLTDSTSNGVLIIGSSSNGFAYAMVAIRGGINTVTEMADPLNAISTTDTDGFLCIMADGDGTYSLKNRLGSTQVFSLFFVGSTS